MEKGKRSWWKRLLFSDLLLGKSYSQKIAYVAVMTAFCVVANLFFEFNLTPTSKISLTMTASAVTGVLLGAGFGFVACFLGDLLGFFCNSAGLLYLPWVGISSGTTALLAGVLICFVGGNDKPLVLYGKIALLCVATFLICTIAINTTAFWLLYSKVSYSTYLVTRLFVQGQIWICLVNSVLLFIAIPLLHRFKFIAG